MGTGQNLRPDMERMDPKAWRRSLVHGVLSGELQPDHDGSNLMKTKAEWADWTRRLQQTLGALLAETIDEKEPDTNTRELVQGAIELEAEAAGLCSV